MTAPKDPAFVPAGNEAQKLFLPLEKSDTAWVRLVLGQWKVGSEVHRLEQFVFFGPRGGGNYFRVGVFAGIHGDERAGAHAAVRFLLELSSTPVLARGYEIYVYPLCNPTGFEDGTRNSRGGKDLNREFWTGSPEIEVQLLERQIRTLHFDGLISLHADEDSPGLYAFALGAQVTMNVVEPALAAASTILPLNADAVIDSFEARNGLIRKGYAGMLSAQPEARPQPFEIVFETPFHADLEKQVAANLIFLKHALAQFLQLQAVGQDL